VTAPGRKTDPNLPGIISNGMVNASRCTCFHHEPDRSPIGNVQIWNAQSTTQAFATSCFHFLGVIMLGSSSRKSREKLQVSHCGVDEERSRPRQANPNQLQHISQSQKACLPFNDQVMVMDASTEKSG